MLHIKSEPIPHDVAEAAAGGDAEAQQKAAVGGAAVDTEADITAKDTAKLGGVKNSAPDFKSLFFMPNPPKEGTKTTKESVAEAAACRSAVTLTVLETRVERFKKHVEDAKKDGDKESETMMQTQLDKYIKEKEALEEKGVGGQVTVAKLSLLQQADATR